LELTDSLALDDFLLALRRFACRRGLPTAFYSDNAKTFIAASDRLLAYFGTHCPKFRRINPLSPWWGGWWERLVRSVKSRLKKTVGKGCLSRKALETTLLEVEATVNSRPLTFVGDTLDTLSPMTPSHFLIGRPAGFQPVVDLEIESVVTTIELQAHEAHRVQRLNDFWKVWSREYLCNLPPIVNKFKSKGDLKKGSLVLIKEDNTPRLCWPVGVVEKLYPGRDGLCRSVEIRTKRGVVTRSIQRLYDLEVLY
jgi:hypothetical protein